MREAVGREAQVLAEADLQAWRKVALRSLLIVVGVAGLPAVLSTVMNAYLTGRMSPLLVAYGAVYLGFVTLAFLQRLPVTPRAWLFIAFVYIIAGASFARVGLVGSGRLYLVFLPAVSVVLVGPRAGYLCLGISLFEFAAFSELARLGVLSRWLTETKNPLDLGTWVESGGALAVILITMSVLLERFFTRHVLTLATSQRVMQELEKAYKALRQRVKDRTRELGLLNSVAAVASGLTDIGEILRVSLEKTMEAFGIEAGGAYGLEDETGTLVMLAHRGLSESFIRSMERVNLHDALAGRDWDLEEPISWAVEEYPSGERREFMEAEGLRRIVGVPLAAGGKLVGGLVVNFRSDRALSHEEGSLLIAIGQQIGLAMVNARLLETQRAQREEAERRQKVAEGMRETLGVLNSDRPTQEILDFVISQACRLMSCDASSLFQIETPEGQLRMQAACGLDLEAVSAIRLALGKGASERALAWKSPIIVPDTSTYDEWQKQQSNPEFAEDLSGLELLMDQGFRAILAVPLIVAGANYGGITLYYREPKTFSEEDISLAMAIGRQAALAIENAKLRAQAEQTAAFAERNRLARELHDSVTQSLYSVTLYAEAAARHLQGGQTSEAAGHLRELGTTAREALREMRLLIFELSPPALQAGTLAEALQTRLDAVEARGGMSVSFVVEGTECLSTRVRQELYQIAQEALNNALKHSRAQAVRIVLAHGEKETRLSISDDGVGFQWEQAQKSGGVGLRGMRQRVERIGGSLSVASQPGGGTTVTVTAPA
ncbi:MAG: GAF domain-containing sensor histidine kinase [Spirochaetia bacterium]|jgi:signal transduction histidine kinase